MDHSYDPREREYEYVATIASLKNELQELRETTDEEYAISVKMAADERDKFQSQLMQITKQRDDAILIQQIQQQHIDVLTNTVLQLEKELLIQQKSNIVELNSTSSSPISEEEEQEENDDDKEENIEEEDDDDAQDSSSCVTVHIEEEEEEESSSIIDITDVNTTAIEGRPTGGEEKSQRKSPLAVDDIECTKTPNPMIKLPFLSTWPDASATSEEDQDETTSSVVSSYNDTTTTPTGGSSTSQHQVEYIYEAVQKKHEREGVFKSIFNVVLAPVVQQSSVGPEHDSIVSYFSKEYNNKQQEGMLCKADVNLMGRFSCEEQEASFVNYVKAQ